MCIRDRLGDFLDPFLVLDAGHVPVLLDERVFIDFGADGFIERGVLPAAADRPDTVCLLYTSRCV